MTNRCLQCHSDNLLEALKCYECGHELSPQPRAPPLAVIGSPDSEFDPPIVATPSPSAKATPPPAALPVVEGTVAALQAEVQRRAQDVAAAQALVTELEQRAVERDGQLQALKARVERQQNDLNARARAPIAPVVPIAAGSQPLLSRAPVALSNRSLALIAVCSVVVVAALGIGGWTLSRPRAAAPPSIPAPVAQDPAPAPPSPASGPSDQVPVQASEDAVVIDANLREQKRLEELKRVLDKKDALVKTRESDAKALEISVKQRDADLIARQAAFNTRDAALKAREAGAAVQSRVQPRIEATRMGYFDFPLIEVKNVPAFTVTKAEMKGEGSSWPTKECTVVAISPLDGNDRAASIPATCTPEHIVISKMKGLKNGHTVRLIWQLK